MEQEDPRLIRMIKQRYLERPPPPGPLKLTMVSDGHKMESDGTSKLRPLVATLKWCGKKLDLVKDWFSAVNSFCNLLKYVFRYTSLRLDSVCCEMIDTDTVTNTHTNIVTKTDTDNDADTNTNTNIDIDTDTNTNTNSDDNTNNDTGTDTDSETDTDTNRQLTASLSPVNNLFIRFPDLVLPIFLGTELRSLKQSDARKRHN